MRFASERRAGAQSAGYGMTSPGPPLRPDDPIRIPPWLCAGPGSWREPGCMRLASQQAHEASGDADHSTEARMIHVSR